MSGHVRYGYIPPVPARSRTLAGRVLAASVAGFGIGLLIGWVWGR